MTTSEHLRFAFGASSLGGFIAAVSDVGIAAFEFGENQAELLDSVAARFPHAILVEDSNGLATTVDKLVDLVDHPGKPADLAVDPRGTADQKRVWDSLCGIPAGTTTTYGDIAKSLGVRDVRDVTDAIASNGLAILIPCHRVIKKDGSISGYRWGVRRKRALIERERKQLSDGQ